MKKPLTLSERLKVCQTCKNCKRDIDRGLVCGLTDNKPDFEESCDKFESDGKAELRQQYRAEADKRIKGKKWWIAAIPLILIIAFNAVKYSVKSSEDSIIDKQVQDYVQNQVNQMIGNHSNSTKKSSSKYDPVKSKFATFEKSIMDYMQKGDELDKQYGDYLPWHVKQEFKEQASELFYGLASWVQSLSEEESDRLWSEIMPNTKHPEVREFLSMLAILYLEQL